MDINHELLADQNKPEEEDGGTRNSPWRWERDASKEAAEEARRGEPAASSASGGEEGKGTAAARVSGLDVGRPLLGALLAEEDVALVEADRPGELLLVELWALEPELRVQIGVR
jgi:hypothetical protein